MDSIWTIMVTLMAFWGRSQGQSPDQPESEAKVKEGESVTLNCTYESGFPTLMWYRHALNRAPQFILHDSSKGDELELRFRHRFASQVDRVLRTFPLTIVDARLTDTAIYYCVLSSVGSTYTKALSFGQGTHLTVLPGHQANLQPSVFVLRSDEAAACLVKDFYPKQAQIFMNSTSGRSTGIEPADPILSISGKYSAVYVDEFPVTEHVRCTVRHEGAVVVDKEALATPEDYSSLHAPAPKTADECETSPELTVHSSEKVNTLSLTVISLRILFAKSLAFNLLLSARYFLF